MGDKEKIKGYVIINDEHLYLVDRSRFKDEWWTSNKKKAIIFRFWNKAHSVCISLKYGNPKIKEYID